jgi:hypothetical protein
MTAVEWLAEELTLPEYGDNPQWVQDAIKKAKQMEKKQLQGCWDISHQAGRYEGKGIAEENWQTFEDYWNEINL